MSKPSRPLARKPTLNPYSFAVREIVNRLKWDLNPISWASRREMKRWRDRFAGEKAVIVCNGPSLQRSDLSLLKGVFTFGLNKINLLYGKTDFRPSCIVATADPVMEQNAEFFNNTDTMLFFRNTGLRWIRPRKNMVFFHIADQYKFARDCSLSLFGGGTVTFAALQLAFHMGFKEVALIGADHSYSRSGPSGEMVTAGSTDPDHFDPNYFAGGVNWQLPEMYLWDFSYSLAKEIYALSDRKIVNATEGGKLEIFQRMSLSTFLSAK